MNKLKVFENAEFGKVRTVTVDGEPWLMRLQTVMLKWIGF